MSVYGKVTWQFSKTLMAGWKLVLLYLAMAILFGILAQQLGRSFVFNLTKSVDGVLFLKQPDERIKRGAIVLFPFKHPVLPRGVEHMTKIVMCLPGDVLHRNGLQFYCNEKLIANAKTHTKQGAPLEVFAWKSGKVPHGFFFAGSPHPDGFDSRYLGFVPLGSATVLEAIL